MARAAGLGQILDHLGQLALQAAAKLAEEARRRFVRLRRKLVERGRLAADIVAALVEHLFQGRHFRRHDGRQPRVDVLARLGQVPAGRPLRRRSEQVNHVLPIARFQADAAQGRMQDAIARHRRPVRPLRHRTPPGSIRASTGR